MAIIVGGQEPPSPCFRVNSKASWPQRSAKGAEAFRQDEPAFVRRWMTTARQVELTGCFSHLVHHVNPVLKAFGKDEQDLRDEAAHTDDAPYLSVH